MAALRLLGGELQRLRREFREGFGDFGSHFISIGCEPLAPGGFRAVTAA